MKYYSTKHSIYLLFSPLLELVESINGDGSLIETICILLRARLITHFVGDRHLFFSSSILQHPPSVRHCNPR